MVDTSLKKFEGMLPQLEEIRAQIARTEWERVHCFKEAEARLAKVVHATDPACSLFIGENPRHFSADPCYDLKISLRDLSKLFEECPQTKTEEINENNS